MDLEARLRGTSVYFPDRAVPMLPIELSSDMCSLRPQVDRLVLWCVMEIDQHGEMVGYTLSEGVIRSAERMTYTNVKLILEGDAGAAQALLQAGGCLRVDARAGDGVEPQTCAARLHRFRSAGAGDRVRPARHHEEHCAFGAQDRHRLIEEFMLTANECVASYVESKGVASLYRIHEKPDPKRIMDFETAERVWLFAGRLRAAGEAGDDEGGPARARWHAAARRRRTRCPRKFR